MTSLFLSPHVPSTDHPLDYQYLRVKHFTSISRLPGGMGIAVHYPSIPTVLDIHVITLNFTTESEEVLDRSPQVFQKVIQVGQEKMKGNICTKYV